MVQNKGSNGLADIIMVSLACVCEVVGDGEGHAAVRLQLYGACFDPAASIRMLLLLLLPLLVRLRLKSTA